jgi:hypothetical protein
LRRPFHFTGRSAWNYGIRSHLEEECMDRADEMLSSHPKPMELDRSLLLDCLRACQRCEQTCTACADACLAEEDVQGLRACIRLNLDCADACGALMRILSRQTQGDWRAIRSQLQAVGEIASLCATECEAHGTAHRHCHICAEACRECEAACAALLQGPPQPA